MSELSPKASALLEAARRAPRAPSKEAVERMEHAVMVAAGVTVGATAAGGAKLWILSATGKSVIGAAALTLAGAAITMSVVTKSSAPVREVRQERVVQPPPVAEPITTPPPPIEVEAEPPPAPPVATPRKTRPPEPRPQPQTQEPTAPAKDLGTEVALLQRAKQSVEAGDWAAALTLLDRHHADFPAAALSIEADVLRVLAWCGDGRIAEARDLAARLRERASRAPAVARLGGSCVDP